MAVVNYTKGINAKLSNNFKVSEFACKGKNCGCTTVKIDKQLVTYLQKIRDHFGKSVTINSGYRCSKHNKAVGGTSGSKHTKGMAADIVVDGVKPAEVAKYAENLGVKGIGLYEGSDGNFVHIDTRAIKSFWYGHAQAKRTTFGGAPKAYTGTFPRIKVTYTVTDKKGKKTTKTRNYLTSGDKGNQVKYLQKFLNWYAGYGLVVDGDYGSKTIIAVKNFQTREKLTVDGKFGSKCLAKAKKVKR